jgi:hypothetical protein
VVGLNGWEKQKIEVNLASILKSFDEHIHHALHEIHVVSKSRLQDAERPARQFSSHRPDVGSARAGCGYGSGGCHAESFCEEHKPMRRIKNPLLRRRSISSPASLIIMR